jgi:hypothetical protein
MHASVLELLQRQLRDGFPDLAGTEISATIPLSDRLINEVVAELLPKGGKVDQLEVQAGDGDQVAVKIRLSARFLPAISATLTIDEQPVLPERPFVGLKLSQSSRLLAVAASALSSTVALPPGVSMENDRIRVDVRRLLAERHLEGWLEYVTALRVNARAGALVLDVRARINPR